MTGLVGLYGGILLISIQPTLKVMHDIEMAGQTLWWNGLIDSAMTEEFLPLTVTGIFMSGLAIIAGYGMMHPRKIDWRWIISIMLAQLIWSFSYRYIGTAFNIASIGIYALTFLYLCRPKVKAYFEYVRRTEKSAQ